ncbi:helix-turn-helix domain-containing protein [uncultured Desulfovibrio sp.]|uniref:helix-turn-helix domain-containing protein n=1 Tax=uncultured Desulfovibrio sp. TaxID=167968 RepID=UPI002625D128|nr:helix-turn-helix domain-containing protein [uncultured Desulfovibrio sp.]
MPFSTTDAHPSGAAATRVQRRILAGLGEIAAYLGVSESTVLRYRKKHGLPVSKMGGRWCADREELDRWRFSVLNKGGRA